MRDDLRKWLTCFEPRPRAPLVLYCLPNAGAGGNVYREWQCGLPGWVEVRPVELPGRWNRFREPLVTSMGVLVEQIAQVVESDPRPFSCFGHSLGGLVAFELARRLRRAGREPVHLLAAARVAPSLPPPRRPIHGLPRGEFLDLLAREYGALPAALLRSEDMLDLLVPILRADVRMLEEYVYLPEPPLRCPITLLTGTDDRSTRSADVGSWKRETDGSVEHHALPGGHFFVHEQTTAVFRIVSAALSRALPT